MLSGQDGSPNSRGIIQKKIDLKKDADWRLFCVCDDVKYH